jgi:hypothetical protein
VRARDAREVARIAWDGVGSCGTPPKDGCRTFAISAIALTVGVWIVLPALVAITLATQGTDGAAGYRVRENRCTAARSSVLFSSATAASPEASASATQCVT